MNSEEKVCAIVISGLRAGRSVKVIVKFPEFWSKEVWPPSSPDCNPLDYYVWSVSERDVNRSPHNTATSLKVKITEVMAYLPRDTVAKACRRFRQRIEAVVEAGGDFFE
jgi:hypothetical protein